MKEFICSCVNPDFESLGVKGLNEFSDLISNAKEINEREFLEVVGLSETELKNIKQFPNDFSFSKNGDIYFYTHSMIEYFFK